MRRRKQVRRDSILLCYHLVTSGLRLLYDLKARCGCISLELSLLLEGPIRIARGMTPRGMPTEPYILPTSWLHPVTPGQAVKVFRFWAVKERRL